MTWYISDLARFRSERVALEQLGLTHDWFVFIGWRFDDRLRLVMEADIVAGEKVWPIYLRYPEFYPHTPASVFPRGDRTRWSNHQYGSGGELCLEYGPDTWTTDLSGIQVVESAYRLLQGENPAPGQTGTVASRHAETFGRSLRSERLRLPLTRSAARALSTVPAGPVVEGAIVYCHHNDATVHVLRKLGAEWKADDVPAQLADDFFERKVFVRRLEVGAARPPLTSDADFRAAFGDELPVDDPLVLLLQGTAVHYHWLLGTGNVIDVPVIEPEGVAARLSTAHEELKTKRVGLVGCGSLGSKWATMLARAGVCTWLLTDDDVLLPDNLVRHELDWSDVGTHKAQALARHLKLVNPGVDTAVWTMQIGAQTAAASAEAILKLLGACDLIIDATANPDVLNTLAAVTAIKRKPVVWAEVFGGGVGGLMARCRPGLEPTPQQMRRAIENWFAEQSAPPVRESRSYETGDDGAPLIADDADVSVIAAHAARFSVDLLSRPVSQFPHSVYAIGLSSGSVFSEPFDTKPIDVGAPVPTNEAAQLSEAEAEVERNKLLELLEPLDEASPSSENREAAQT